MSEVSTVQQQQEANKFIFTDRHSHTQIVFFPHAPGPLRQGQILGEPELEYRGHEGTLTFFGKQIERQESPQGSLLTVVLERSLDAGALTLTLVLPPVNLGNKQQQTFNTVAIKTKSFGILPREGARLTYDVLTLQGVAEKVILPL